MPISDEVEQMERNDEFRSKLPIAIIIALVCVSAICIVLMASDRRQARDLAAANRSLNLSLEQMKGELQTVTGRLNNALESQTAPAQPAAVAAPVHSAPRRAPRSSAASPGRPAAQARPAREDPRWNQIQAQLADQQKLIASTREDIGKARDELQGELNDTRDTLSTSIARNHEEVVVLQKRGERNYYEFEINKAKQFQRVGPVRVSLRKANVKRKYFDMAMMVDDNELQKKNVNLYEPVWLNVGGDQLELVVNQINKDHIRGYLSEPKYKRAQLGLAEPVAAKRTLQ